MCGGKADGGILGRQPRTRIVAADTYEQVNGIGQEWACLGAPPRELEPGAEIRDSVLLITASATRCARHAGQPLRIRYEIMADPADDVKSGNRLAVEEEVSNPFVIDVPVAINDGDAYTPWIRQERSVSACRPLPGVSQFERVNPTVKVALIDRIPRYFDEVSNVAPLELGVTQFTPFELRED